MNKSKLSLRFIAYLIDWYVGALLTGLPITFLSQKINGTMTQLNLLEYPSKYSIIVGILSLLLGNLYYCIIPIYKYKYKGQTLGKHICRLKIVKIDDSDVDIKTILIRNFVGIVIIEGSLYTASNILHQLIVIITGFNVIKVLMYISFGITLLSVIMLIMTDENRSLHDWLADTKVISIS